MKKCNCGRKSMDFGPEPYVADIKELAMDNDYFRAAVWTGEYLQMTVMSIPVCGEIGWEVHSDTDQFIRVEQGRAVVKFEECRCKPVTEKEINENDGVFVPAGTRHNVVNAGKCPLKLTSIYAPPHHPRGTIHRTKEDSEY